ncbi:MAG: FtsX-like permease family protein, partial [Burkholderiaceae bacterium]
MISAASVVFRGSLAQNTARTALSVLAIALGVALGYAVQLINQAAINELSFGVQTLSGDADLDVRGPRGGFDEAIYPRLAAMPEVAVASPVVEVDAKLADRADTLRILGIDVFRAGYIQPALIPSPGDRLDLMRPDNIFLSPAAARWLGVEPGDTLKLQVALADVPLKVAGLLSTGAQQRFAVMDIAGAQTGFDRSGRVSRIDLRLRPGVDVSAFREHVQQNLPAGLVIDRPAATLAASTGLSRSYRVNLNVLALVALFTGGLLVFSTQALGVVRRRSQFALLRVLGVTRRMLVVLIVAESALVGVVGSVLGLLAGFGLATLAMQWVGGDLGSGYFRAIAPTLAVEPL